MFSTPWPETAEDPDLVRDAVHSFDILRQVLRRLHGAAESSERVDLDALFVWSCMHGLAGAVNGEAISKLDLKAGLLDQATAHAMHKVRQALGG